MTRRKYNRSYFSKIDSIEKAYWLGFIAADGSVRLKRDASLSIGLKESDRSHLTTFSETLGYDGKLLYKKKTKAWQITLYGKEIVNDLIKVGVTPRKTYKLKPWQGPSKLMTAYWRGFFDGDGCISSCINKKNYKKWHVSLIGTPAICNAFLKFVDVPFKHHRRKISKIDVVSWSSIRPCQNIVNKLYDGDGPRLQRKKSLAEEMLKQEVRENRIQSIPTEQLLDLREKHESWEKVAAHLKISRNGLYKHIRKLGIPRRTWRKSS
jgi:hypothetical protein